MGTIHDGERNSGGALHDVWLTYYQKVQEANDSSKVEKINKALDFMIGLISGYRVTNYLSDGVLIADLVAQVFRWMTE